MPQHRGQVCCASSRLFVQDTIYDAFVKRTVEEAEKRTIGGPASGSVQGPQVDDIQFKNVLGYIAKGKEEGAKCLTGGSVQFSAQCAVRGVQCVVCGVRQANACAANQPPVLHRAGHVLARAYRVLARADRVLTVC